MIHNIVTDRNGNEHQAVKQIGVDCLRCSLNDECCISINGSECQPQERDDKQFVIYKRRIKIGDIKNER